MRSFITFVVVLFGATQGRGDDYASLQSEVIGNISTELRQYIVKVEVEREGVAGAPKGSKTFELIVAEPPRYITGTILTPDLIVVNLFNLRNHKSLTVHYEGNRYSAEALVKKEELDVAIIKTDEELFKEMPYPSWVHHEGEVRQGEFCYLLGANPYEYSDDILVTHGIVSAAYRHDNRFFQTDAKMNYGNMGGPVVDMYGRLMGIACKVDDKTPWTQSSGVGFVLKASELIGMISKYTAAYEGFPILLNENGPSGKLEAYQEKFIGMVKKAVKSYAFILTGGSGLVISGEGHILTNFHVIAMALQRGLTQFECVVDSKKYICSLVAFDRFSDFALLKIDSEKKFEHVELGDSDRVEIGDMSFAVGNPFMTGYAKGTPLPMMQMPGGEKRGDKKKKKAPPMPLPDGNWEPTVTLGQVTALHRYQDWYLDAVQTDAAINPGNSGGPLFDMKGDVIGIVGRLGIKYMDLFWRAFAGIGFAISSTHVNRYLPVLMKGENVYHGYIDGVKIGDPDPDKFQTPWQRGDGVLIAGVVTGSVADESGFEPGDLVVEIAGYKVRNVNRFHGVVGSFPAGSEVNVKVLRESEGNPVEVELKVLLGNPKLLDK